MSALSLNMRCKKIGLFLLLSVLLNAIQAQQEDVIRIGIYGGKGLTKVNAQANVGTYELFGDGRLIATLGPNSSCTMVPAGQKVSVKAKQGNLGNFTRVVLRSKQADGSFRMQASSASAVVKNSVYPNNLIARAYGGKLILVNESELDRYISGVTEAEAGKGHEPEFYKVQSLIARTYALANLNRHATKGFHVCDEVHCQAYHGSARFEPLIHEATEATRDQVLVDSNIRLITAAFHSNCGGHTLNSEHVWSKPLPYLVGRRDTFCLVMPHSHWEKSFQKQSWVEYLSTRNAVAASSNDSSFTLAYYPTQRERFFADSTSSLRMTKIRSDWGLKSAFFVIEEEGDSVRFTGRGFGHGVGLCQEGGMRMAQLGHDCRSIVHFYYKDVHIIDRRRIDFFAD